MTTNIDRAADLIANATIPLGASVARGMDRAILAAQALADAGLLMPDLPHDDTGELSSGEWSAGFDYQKDWNGELRTYHSHTYAQAPGIIGISTPRHMTTDQAEGLLAALAAAITTEHAMQKKEKP